MRLLFASCIAAAFGLIAQIVAFGVEVALADGQFYLPMADWAMVPFALATAIEITAIMALWMYRIAPWLLLLMRDRFECERIRKAKPGAIGWIRHTIVIATIVCAIFRVAETGQFPLVPLMSAAVGLAPLLLPLPKPDVVSRNFGSAEKSPFAQQD
ncbi:MAG TPA: hypothetical protein VK178_11390 [Opitutaceae bacterium]|nr:hypothetical protein [Opitutaceae bacterium]